MTLRDSTKLEFHLYATHLGERANVKRCILVLCPGYQTLPSGFYVDLNMNIKDNRFSGRVKDKSLCGKRVANFKTGTHW